MASSAAEGASAYQNSAASARDLSRFAGAEPLTVACADLLRARANPNPNPDPDPDPDPNPNPNPNPNPSQVYLLGLKEQLTAHDLPSHPLHEQVLSP